MANLKITTGKVRFSYAHVFEPYAMDEDSEKKYQVSLIIPKSDKVTVEKIQTAIKEALEAGISKFGGVLPKKYTNPLRDGDLERDDDPAYEGCYYINVKSKTRPGIVDVNLNAIIDPDEFYSGCFGRASITFYAYNTAGNKGVSAALNNLQKLADGERLSASNSKPEDDFADASDDIL